MNPYQSLGTRHFWKSAVASVNMHEITDLWEPKYKISRNAEIATFGSCFAQHFGRSLQRRDFSWLDTEPAPYGLPDTAKSDMGFGVFTCRTGNIYTCSMLRQWAEWSLSDVEMPAEYWERDGRFVDPFRPTIEPDGFASIEELQKTREKTLAAFAKAVQAADIFVFTLGLTERWLNRKSGCEYPVVPGAAAGEYRSEDHYFDNADFASVLKELSGAMRIMRHRNDKLRFLLTVSPVPLVATNSGQHVLVGTTYSKSVLRAVAGKLASSRRYVDYFPSYEIISSPVFRGGFFEPNMRSVSRSGVEFVMQSFFDGLSRKFGIRTDIRLGRRKSGGEFDEEIDDAICDEELLSAFGTGS